MIEEAEEGLVEAAIGGHLESFAALYERYYRPMVGLAYSVLADAQLAEDATQQVFVIVCRDLPKLKSKDKFGPWLCSICRNVAKHMRKTAGKTVALDGQIQHRGESKADSRIEAIRRAVWKLRAVHREPIVLRYYDNMSYERIAAVLGITPQAVHGRLIRAKRKIKRYLERNGFAGGDYETS